MDIIDMRTDELLERHGRKKRINAIFIAEDEKPEFKPFCPICHVYAVYIKNNGYECPRCGREFREEAPQEAGKLGNRYKSDPIIITRDMAKKRKRSDFPEGAFVTEDRQINPDGEEQELIIDGKDV